jgi:hypothetical protein
MKTLVQISILILLFFLSCNKSHKSDNIQETTPEVFNEGAKIDLNSFSKRGSDDLITKLFDEAMKNDPKLEKLMSDIYKFDTSKELDLKKYDDFKNFNESYKNAYNRMLNQIKDSVLKIETKKLFDQLIQLQDAKNNILIEKETALNTKQALLNDKVVLMKLFVTFPMMQKYWDNEIPTVKIFDKPNSAIDSLLEKTQTYTSIVK